VQTAQDALGICHAEGVICPTVLVYNADILNLDADINGNAKNRAVAETHCREALSLRTGHALRATALQTLTWILFRRFEITGTPDLIDEAISLQRSALTDIPPDSLPSRHRHLSNLGGCLWRRFNILGDSDNLEDAIPLLRSSVDICPTSHVDCERTAVRLTVALLNRFEITGAIEDLEEALEVGRKPLNANGPSGHARLYTLNTVACIIQRLFETNLASDSRLDEMISMFEQAATLSPPGHRSYLMCRNNLANGLRMRFLWDGQLSDLEKAIQLRRQALQHVVEDEAEPWTYYANLGDELCLRYRELGNFDDLTEALKLYRKAVDIKPENHATSWIEYRALAAALNLRFESTQSEEDLEEAVTLLDKFADSLPLDHRYRAQVVQVLSYALNSRAKHRKNAIDVDRAIHLLESIDINFLDSAFGSEYLRTLGTSYLARYRLEKIDADADRARTIMTHLLERLAIGRRDRFQCLVDLAELYLESGTSFGDISIALGYLAQGIDDNHRDVRSRISGALRLLQSVEAHHSNTAHSEQRTGLQLLDLYTSVIGLLPRLVYFSLNLPSRLEPLAASQDLASIAASHALRLRQPERAVEILEQGRAIFWMHSLQLRSPFDDVPGELRQQLITLARQLERSNDIFHGQDESQLVEKALARRRQQSDEFQALVHQVRSTLPGMERFMLPDEYSTLAKAADQGPAVILVSNTVASNAIIIRPEGAVVDLSLPSVTDSWLLRTADVWRSAMMEARSHSSRLHLVKQKKPSKASCGNALGQVLADLWTKVVWPVIDTLGLQVGRT
jgi:tetratricopeptide (TPR) repeat protein